MSISVSINGQQRVLEVDESRSLLDIIRNDLFLSGSHFGCGGGDCGACMMLLDGRPVTSCNVPLWSVDKRDVTTIEGLREAEIGSKVMRAFVEAGAAQCGYCTSGMVVAATGLLMNHPHPSEQVIRQQMDANLCRCGSHLRILKAIVRVADDLQQDTES
ncbi:(2Fe-2S)-binding protein [Advenella kashmirensis W13003]|uniref:(2Fe-2S)-binding protein n=1 Tax=Advenella kashmirensis W13003 TaxID=1424334 RepID=V8QUU8_9BURK|nr:2Fe-2S iron-sulfur cluster-binding protein [Advenella kashmirensis]ETF03716.1 (2Fe-2S)-binding protein [Advenella kashmirensis W13003]